MTSLSASDSNLHRNSFRSALVLAALSSLSHGCSSASLPTQPEEASLQPAVIRAFAKPNPEADATDQTSVETDETLSIELAFITHLEMNLPEQDVYIEREPGSGEVFRPTQGDNDMSALLYKTAVTVPHNPFDPAQIGPHPKGESFGMTLGEWLAHRGTGVYAAKDGAGTLDLEFTGLVPRGIYTLWHVFGAFPPTKPFSGTLKLPLGARDGSESVFTADEQGRARFRHTFTPELELSDVWTRSMLALNYHSDGKTYGGLPGDFGLNAHIPLFVMLPFRDGLR